MCFYSGRPFGYKNFMIIKLDALPDVFDVQVVDVDLAISYQCSASWFI